MCYSCSPRERQVLSAWVPASLSLVTMSVCVCARAPVLLNNACVQYAQWVCVREHIGWKHVHLSRGPGPAELPCCGHNRSAFYQQSPFTPSASRLKRIWSLWLKYRFQLSTALREQDKCLVGECLQNIPNMECWTVSLPFTSGLRVWRPVRCDFSVLAQMKWASEVKPL